MQAKNLFKRFNLMLAFTALAFFVVLIFNFIPKSSNHIVSTLIINNTAPISVEDRSGVGLPVRLKIPAISLDATIEFVGVTSDGSMDTPINPFDVAWLKFSAHPGDKGVSVIDGHYGFKNGKGAAFDDLYKLRKDDKVYVQSDNGTTSTFIVQGNRRYDPNADASSVFTSRDGKAHLNLITCEGVWSNVSGGYPTRLVVFADKE